MMLTSHRFRRASLCLASAVAVIAATACGGGDSSGPGGGGGGGTPTPSPSLSIAAGTVAIGGTIPRKAWINGQLVQADWRSDNAAVARISSDGVVTGVAAGTTTIRATAGQSSGSAEITVADLRFEQLVVGGRNACAQADSGVWFCWGDNGVATLGRLSGSAEICASQRRECSTTPRVALGWPSFDKMSISGGGLSCGLTSTGVIHCWGRNDSHLFFPGATQSCEVYSGRDDVPNDFFVCSRDPVAIVSSVSFANVVAGGVVCGLAADGTAHCWGGSDAAGQVGAAATGTCDGVACVPPPGLPVANVKFKQLSVGSGTTCGASLGNTGYCWGSNHVGQRGADVSEGPALNIISGGHAFSTLSIFRDHTCGVALDGDGYCWGANNFGQLARSPSELSASSTPQLVSGGLKFVTISAGLTSSCGLATDGAAYCWGQNTAGQVGDGTTESRSTPTLVAGGHRFTQVTSGRSFTCGLTVERTVYCWGSNTFGELGYGESGTALFGAYFSSTPVGVGGLP